MDKALNGGNITLYVFFLLLPGLLGSIIYDYFLEGEKRDNTDRVATALILTLISSLSMQYLFSMPILPKIEITNETRIDIIINAFLAKSLLCTSLLSSAIAFVFALLNNYEIIYGALRKAGITIKVSKSDVWQDMFYQNRGYWIKVSFKDGRSLVGWPKLFSSNEKPREIFVADATWYRMSEDGDATATDVSGPECISQISMTSSRSRCWNRRGKWANR